MLNFNNIVVIDSCLGSANLLVATFVTGRQALQTIEFEWSDCYFVLCKKPITISATTITTIIVKTSNNYSKLHGNFFPNYKGSRFPIHEPSSPNPSHRSVTPNYKGTFFQFRRELFSKLQGIPISKALSLQYRKMQITVATQ